MKFSTFLACTLALIIGAPATAQQPSNRQPRRVAAMVVLVDSIKQPDAPFVIMRRPGSSPADLIVLRTGANAAQLSDAIRGLLTARAANGDVAATPATFRVRPHQRTGARGRPEFPWARRVLNDLRRAELREINGVGRVRAVQIWLPRQQARQTAPRS